MGKTYVVFVGRKSGIYDNWVDAQEQINGFSGASHQGYRSREEALKAFEKYMEKKSSSSTSTTSFNSTSKNACSSSTSTATATATASASSSRKQKQNEKIAQLVEAQAGYSSGTSEKCVKNDGDFRGAQTHAGIPSF